MPQTDEYGQHIESPVLGDVPNIETAFKKVVSGLLSRAVLRFANASSRAASLIGGAAPVAGMITYLKAEDRYDARMNDGTWQAITPTPWIPISFRPGYEANSGSPAYRVTNGSVELRGTVKRTNDDPFAKNSGLVVAILPEAVWPTHYRMFSVATEHAATMHARLEVSPVTGALTLIVPPSTATGAKWAALDGIRYSLT
ncbi:hypothetical protein [Streptomyces sp. NBC_00239]|uniref:hypothetical protein n=1 Tax=Streptomyces sp. NBC_00239 TaxID=2903640 RepID=UPI002E2D8E52|nr:hypothetical protein [Streptomyces sp. NBC_00239]